MSDINPIGRPGLPPLRSDRPQNQPAPINGHAPVNGHARRNGQDAVEFSDRARLLSQLREVPDVRQGMVDRIKTEIELGTYETDEKINAALDAMIDSGDLA